MIVWFDSKGRILQVGDTVLAFKNAGVDTSFDFPTLPDPNPSVLGVMYRVRNNGTAFRAATNSEQVDAQIWIDVTNQYQEKMAGDLVLAGVVEWTAQKFAVDEEIAAKQITRKMRGVSDV